MHSVCIMGNFGFCYSYLLASRHAGGQLLLYHPVRAHSDRLDGVAPMWRAVLQYAANPC